MCVHRSGSRIRRRSESETSECVERVVRIELVRVQLPGPAGIFLKCVSRPRVRYPCSSEKSEKSLLRRGAAWKVAWRGGGGPVCATLIPPWTRGVSRCAPEGRCGSRTSRLTRCQRSLPRAARGLALGRSSAARPQHCHSGPQASRSSSTRSGQWSEPRNPSREAPRPHTIARTTRTPSLGTMQ